VKTKYLFSRRDFHRIRWHVLAIRTTHQRRQRTPLLEHRGEQALYWCKVVQRPVLYLGEINDDQREAWCRVIEALDQDDQKNRQLALFPADRGVPEHAKGYGVQVRLDAMELHRPRQWGACWLACQLYKQLELDRFWAARLPNSREGTSWQHTRESSSTIRTVSSLPWKVCATGAAASLALSQTRFRYVKFN
jgi:hypothetical protein